MAEHMLQEPNRAARVPRPAEPQLDLLEHGRGGRADALLQFRVEFDGYRRQMRDFVTMEPDEVLIALSAFSARASEVRVLLWRDGSRLAQKMRTEEMDPFIDECDRQFKVHSRLQTIRELDWRMTGGAPS